MRGIRRRLLLFSAFVSVLLFLMVCAIYVRSFWCDDYAQCSTHFRSGTIQYTIESIRGTLEFRISRLPGIGASDGSVLAMFPTRWSLVTESPTDQPAYPHALWWFDGERGNILDTVNMSRAGVFLPTWVMLVITGLPPLIAWKFRRRTKPGMCPTCGYDLRASPDRCPECGKVLKETREEACPNR